MMRDDALQMVQCRVLKTLSLMADKKYDDPDLTEDIEFLTEKLHENVQDLRLGYRRYVTMTTMTLVDLGVIVLKTVLTN